MSLGSISDLLVALLVMSLGSISDVIGPYQWPISDLLVMSLGSISDLLVTCSDFTSH